MQDVEFAVVALAGDPAEPLELVPAQRVKPLVTRSVLQQQNVVRCKNTMRTTDWVERRTNQHLTMSL